VFWFKAKKNYGRELCQIFLEVDYFFRGSLCFVWIKVLCLNFILRILVDFKPTQIFKKLI
jgi:hypothetical protein